LANADVTAIVPDAMSKVTGAETKASVHALSSQAAMILDMSVFLFVMVDKELPMIDRSATWPHQ